MPRPLKAITSHPLSNVVTLGCCREPAAAGLTGVSAASTAAPAKLHVVITVHRPAGQGDLKLAAEQRRDHRVHLITEAAGVGCADDRELGMERIEHTMRHFRVNAGLILPREDPPPIVQPDGLNACGSVAPTPTAGS